MYVNWFIYIHTSVNKYIDVFIRICVYIYIYINIYICTCMYIYVFIYTYIYLHTHTHTYIERECRCVKLLFWWPYIYVCYDNHLGHPCLQLRKRRLEPKRIRNVSPLLVPVNTT